MTPEQHLEPRLCLIYLRHLVPITRNCSSPAGSGARPGSSLGPLLLHPWSQTLDTGPQGHQAGGRVANWLLPCLEDQLDFQVQAAQPSRRGHVHQVFSFGVVSVSLSCPSWTAPALATQQDQVRLLWARSTHASTHSQTYQG